MKRPLHNAVGTNIEAFNGNQVGMHNAASENEDLAPNDEEEVPLGELNTYMTVDDEKPRGMETTAIRISELSDYITTRRNATNGFHDEYKSISLSMRSSCDCATRKGIEKKNRYKAIYPYDNSRVKLPLLEDDPLTDYINANFIPGYKVSRRKHYIAAQGPTVNTIADFWRMIWENDVSYIAMVTNLIERGKKKCEQYWPDMGQSVTYENKIIKTTEERVYPDVTIRTILIDQELVKQEVKQFHFTSWPDHGVPKHGMALVKFRRILRAQMAPKRFETRSSGPLVIHCSAGVGRTGTLIALDILLEQMDKDSKVDVYKCVDHMRDFRPFMIQTEEQYVFIYTTLLEAATVGQTLVPRSDFPAFFHMISTTKRGQDLSKIHSQFNMLEVFRVPVTQEILEDRDGMLPENKAKNRFFDIIPEDLRRPCLTSDIPGTNDYVNAISVEGYKNYQLIATQAPLPETGVDLWRMVHDYGCHTVVMLNTPSEVDKDCQYYPDLKEIKSFESVKVKCDHLVSSTYHDLRKMTLIFNGEKRRVCHYSIRQPLDASHESDAVSTLLSIFDHFQKWQRKNNDSTIVVQCLDGCHWSGVFCALINICEQINTDKEVDVFQNILHLQTQQPLFVSDIQDYKLIHTAVLTYLESLETTEIYENN